MIIIYRILLLFLLIFTTSIYSQNLKLALGGGITTFQSPNTFIKDVGNDGFGFGNELFFGLKVKHSFPNFPVKIIAKLKYIYASGKGERQIVNSDLNVETASFEISKSIFSGGIGGEVFFFEGPYSPFFSFDLLYNAIGDTRANIQSSLGSGDFDLQKSGRRVGFGLGVGVIVKEIAEGTDLELNLNYNFLNMIGQEVDEGNINVFSIGAYFLL